MNRLHRIFQDDSRTVVTSAEKYAETTPHSLLQMLEALVDIAERRGKDFVLGRLPHINLIILYDRALTVYRKTIQNNF